MQNYKLSPIRQFKETYLLYSNTALEMHQARTKTGIIQKQTTLGKVKIPTQHVCLITKSRTDLKISYQVQLNCTHWPDNKDVAIT